MRTEEDTTQQKFEKKNKTAEATFFTTVWFMLIYGVLLALLLLNLENTYLKPIVNSEQFHTLF